MPLSSQSHAKPAKRPTGILGVHPVLAAVLAIALVCAGAVFGAWLNLTSRQPMIAKAGQSKTFVSKLRTAPPELFKSEIASSDDIEPERQLEATKTPSILDKPEPRAVEPVPQALSNTAVAQATPFEEADGKPAIAIVIDDMGLNRVNSDRALSLPAPITLSFLTYATNLPMWAMRARDSGHEVLAHLPMEPLDPNEKPGPGALTLALTDAEINTRLAAALDSWSGYVGVNNHMGSRFTADTAKMTLVMTAMKERGLMWFDSKTAGNSVGPTLARAMGVPVVERDVFLDNIQTPAEVFKELALVEETARQRGTVIAIGHPHEVTLTALSEWITSLPAKGFVLAPLSEVVRRQTARVQQRAER